MTATATKAPKTKGKIIVGCEAFVAAIKAASAIVKGRSPSAVLTGIHLYTENKTLHVHATNLEQSLEIAVEEVDLQQGEIDCVVSALKLQQIATATDDPTLTLTQTGDNMNFASASTQFNIFGYPAKDFPGITEVHPDRKQFVLQSRDLRQLLHSTAWSIGTEQSRYSMMGTLLSVNSKRTRAVTTNGRSLAYMDIDTGPSTAEFGVLLPASMVSLMLRNLPDSDDCEVAVAYDGYQVEVIVDHIRIVSNLLEGSFPPYEDVIPRDSKTTVDVDSGAIESAIRIASITTDEESKGVSFSFDSDGITLTSRAPEMGETETRCDATVKGDELRIGLAPQYIIPAIKSAPGSRVELRMTQSNKACVVASGGYIAVVMPINLQ